MDQNPQPIKKPEPANKSNPEMHKTQSDGPSRMERLQSLKQQFAAGRPVNASQLADSMIESGVIRGE